MIAAVIGALALGFGGPAAADPPKPIPPAKALALPSVGRCITERTLTFRLRTLPGVTWAGASVNVDGKRFKRITRAAVTRPVKLTRLLERTLVLSVTARASDGRSATAERTYQSCRNRRPVITVPPGAPPATLMLRDITVGGGREAKPGRDVSVQYAGVAWSNGKEFDATWDRGGEPLDFPLGAEVVLPGFEQGIAGMRVGGRREIIIPPDLGYGEGGSGPIRPNETLIFVVDLVGVRYR